MDDFNKQQLDALFKEGAERYDFTYREDAWASMDEMLDKQDKQRKYRFIGWWLVVGLAALTGIFGLKHYTSDNELKEESNRLEQNIASVEKTTINEEEVAIEDNSILTKEIKETSTSLVVENENKNQEILKTNTSKNEAITATDLSKIETIKVSENNQNSKDTHSTPRFFNEGETGIQEALKSEIVSSSSEKHISQKQTSMLSTVTNPVRSKHTNSIVSIPSGNLSFLTNNSDRISTIQLPTITLGNTNGINELEQPKIPNRFSFGITAGPEFSFIGGTGRAKAGYYLGVELGYQLSKRFEVFTGVGVSQKRYLGDGASYKTEPGFWTDEIVPMEFEGTCTVIEIPLAVNYYFNDVNENGWFTNIGATTYLMSSEWYDFIYHPSITRTDLKSHWGDKMANNHLLGVGQVSVGYQHKIGKHTSLQISPYAKIPLTGIGNGSVNLFSTGLRLTAKFK